MYVTNTAKVEFNGITLNASCVIKIKGVNKMSCCCENVLKSTSVAVVGTTLQITVPAVTFENLKEYSLIICQSIPKNAGISQVVIVPQGKTPINLFGVCGNYVRADQIKCRKRYAIVYGNDPIHFSMVGRIPYTGYLVQG